MQLRPADLSQNLPLQSYNAGFKWSSEALLPVISASISGRNSLYKHANVLLNSGVQISLIQLETTEILGLEGKGVSVTITKVGGKEEMTTKVFKVQVTSLDNQKTFTVKAICISCISDDVLNVKKKKRSLKVWV